MALQGEERGVYSDLTLAFVKRVQQLLRSILESEMHIDIRRSRFIYQNYTYKLTVVPFMGSRRVAYFDRSLFEIGVNRQLLYSDAHFLKNTLRHELAHMMVFLKYGNVGIADHGSEFRDLCRSFGWGAEVYSAKTELESEMGKELSLKEAKLLNQVKKLFSLAQSQEGHESEAAALKANELLLKYNLQNLVEQENEESLIVARVMSGKRVSALQKTVGQILKSFYVSAVYNYGSEGFYYEVIGQRANVELARYVSDFLLYELPRLWKLEKAKNHRLKGLKSQNSFYRGVADGYLKKVNVTAQQWADSKQLVRMNQLRESEMRKVYPRLSHSYSSRTSHCEEAWAQGQSQGHALNIRPGLEENRSGSIRQLTSNKF
ncbi:MAG: DUF2786 domain-containing protein [Bdellovibrionales bacterium]|nr:DUF2786 domain-containing protein [Bdellovibrionales bacterium]